MFYTDSGGIFQDSPFPCLHSYVARNWFWLLLKCFNALYVWHHKELLLSIRDQRMACNGHSGYSQGTWPACVLAISLLQHQKASDSVLLWLGRCQWSSSLRSHGMGCLNQDMDTIHWSLWSAAWGSQITCLVEHPVLPLSTIQGPTWTMFT